MPLVKKGAHALRLTGTSDGADATMVVQGGTLAFAEAARWGGRSVAATGASTVLRFCGSNLTQPEATVSVADGATIDLSTLAVVPRLTLDGASVANGFYRAADYPAVLSGAGLLSVGGVAVATWVGGAAGAWSNGANWSTGEAPRGTTVAWFTNAVELANETFDFGADGVCIWNGTGVNLVSRTMFAGSGKFYKFGAGQIEYAAESTYTGGTLLADGCARLATYGANCFFGAAEGTVELACSADGNGPYFEFGSFGMTLPYAIRFVGKTNVQRIQITNNIRLAGSVESDSDFRIWSAWGPLYADCGFRAVGKTITFEENDEGRGFVSYIAGAVDASLLKKGTGLLELRGVSAGAANVLTADAGTLRLTDAAAWEGPVVVNKGGRLVLGGSANLSPAATLTVAAGGTVEVSAGVKVSVAALVVGGKELPAGVYSAATHPDVFAGEGRVRVGTPGVVIVVR